MSFKDNLEIPPKEYGIFNIKTFDANDNLIDEYTEKNLIVATARESMAAAIGGKTGSGIGPINKFVMGTKGHVGGNVLLPLNVGDNQPPLGVFNTTRIKLFSEQASNEYYYTVTFNPASTTNEKTDYGLGGVLKRGNSNVVTNTDGNTVKRSNSGNIVTFTITIGESSSNISTGSGVIPFTEAALYSGGNLFAMKTFPARVKENSVKFVITWSIIF